jgi:hypothetical protein
MITTTPENQYDDDVVLCERVLTDQNDYYELLDAQRRARRARLRQMSHKTVQRSATLRRSNMTRPSMIQEDGGSIPLTCALYSGVILYFIPVVLYTPLPHRAHATRVPPNCFTCPQSTDVN